MKCNRCKEPTDWVEACWWCLEGLCAACWEEHGHCGHQEAEAVNERARAVKQPETGK